VAQEEHLDDPVVPGVPAALAGGAPTSDAPEAAAPKPEPVPIAGTPYVRGRATVTVRAPLARVRDAILDVAHYSELVPHCKTSTVADTRASGSRDGYLEIEAPEGLLRMAVEVAKPVAAADGTESVQIRSYKGNVRTFELTWRLRKGNRGATQLSLEVFLDLGAAVPPEVLNQENLARALEGVVAVRDRVERRR